MCVCVCVYIYIYIYIYTCHFIVQKKLVQHCKSTTTNKRRAHSGFSIVLDLGPNLTFDRTPAPEKVFKRKRTLKRFGVIGSSICHEAQGSLSSSIGSGLEDSWPQRPVLSTPPGSSGPELSVCPAPGPCKSLNTSSWRTRLGVGGGRRLRNQITWIYEALATVWPWAMNLLCASVFSSVKGDDNSTYSIGLWWRLNEFKS